MAEKTISLRYFNRETKKLEQAFAELENPTNEQKMLYMKALALLAMALT